MGLFSSSFLIFLIIIGAIIKLLVIVIILATTTTTTTTTTTGRHTALRTYARKSHVHIVYSWRRRDRQRSLSDRRLSFDFLAKSQTSGIVFWQGERNTGLVLLSFSPSVCVFVFVFLLEVIYIENSHIIFPRMTATGPPGSSKRLMIFMCFFYC